MISTGGSWSVVVLVGAFGLQFFTAILTYGTGFIHLSLLEVYKESDATTSIVGSLFINLMSVTGTPMLTNIPSVQEKGKVLHM